MARELRHEILTGTTDDADVGDDADSEFRNDSAGMIHIRRIHAVISLATAQADESARMEVSKAPTLQMLTQNSPFFSYPMEVVSEGATTGAAVDDAAWAKNYSSAWGKGQLTLEPNESLFINTAKTSGGQLKYTILIEYEFT